jgi:hypothetical protein
MQALKKRHIAPGHAFDKLFPKSSGQDKVIRPEGKAQLHHTINLIKQVVRDTKGDTALLAKTLKGKTLQDTCENIWDFVYNHIQYARDKAGVEQVRRPSRTWTDRKTGVDCDCYSVFISSILTNLDIPHKVRITKYGIKPYFQHIYPIVPNETGYFTLDCVTDQFNYEVPYSEARDFDIDDRKPVGEINGIREVSGVDSADLLIDGLGIYNLKQPRLPLRQIRKLGHKQNQMTTPDMLTLRKVPEQKISSQPVLQLTQAQPKVEVALALEKQTAPRAKGKIIGLGLTGKIFLALGIGLGAYKLTEILT